VTLRSTQRRFALIPCVLFLHAFAAAQATAANTQPSHLTAEQDHQRLMDLLRITSLRRGADGDPKSPNAANYDESKAKPYPSLPTPCG
jgi:hypothetical protein